MFINPVEQPASFSFLRLSSIFLSSFSSYTSIYLTEGLSVCHVLRHIRGWFELWRTAARRRDRNHRFMDANFSNASPIPIIEGYTSSGIVNTDSLPDTGVLPPPLPLNSIYTSCYCEENVYLLAQTFQKLSVEDKAAFPWDIYVVFISNDDKTVSVWHLEYCPS